jgi:hypothetical protein
VLEEQQIRELDELREEQAEDDEERGQRRRPDAHTPAGTALREAAGSGALIHPRCN